VERNGNNALLAQVQFAHDKDVLLATSLPVLDEVAKVLTDHPEFERVRIEGHTDGHGKPGYNRKLSQRRAESVLRYLVHVGIAPERLEARGCGADVPIAPNDTEEGRAKNRRVEFVPLEGPKPEKT
jgi:outer membrane protein OmpA-like peptidoglycan-associated protein